MKTVTLKITLPDGALVTLTGSYEYVQDEAPIVYTGPSERLLPFWPGTDTLPEAIEGGMLLDLGNSMTHAGVKTEVVESGEWKYMMPDAKEIE
jgi:hypothetical protein